MANDGSLAERIQRIRSSTGKAEQEMLVESFSWESFLTQYNQRDVMVQDELEDFQYLDTVDSVVTTV